MHSVRFLLLFLLLGMPPSVGAEYAWVRFDPGPPGDATAEGYRDGWSVVDGFRLDAVLAEGEPGSFYITRPIDRSSGPVAAALAVGEVFPRVDIDIASPRLDDDLDLSVRVRLEDAMLLSQFVNWGGVDEPPREVLELAFSTITYIYFLPGTEGEGTFARFDYEKQDGEAGSFTDGGPIGDGDVSGPSWPAFRATLSRLADEPGVMRLSWESEAGKDYLVEWSPDLILPFETVDVIRAEGTTTFIEIPVDGPSGFFRVRAE